LTTLRPNRLHLYWLSEKSHLRPGMYPRATAVSKTSGKRMGLKGLKTFFVMWSSISPQTISTKRIPKRSILVRGLLARIVEPTSVVNRRTLPIIITIKGIRVRRGARPYFLTILETLRTNSCAAQMKPTATRI